MLYIPSNGQGAGRDMEPVSSDLPNSELEKTPVETNVYCRRNTIAGPGPMPRAPKRACAPGLLINPPLIVLGECSEEAGHGHVIRSLIEIPDS